MARGKDVRLGVGATTIRQFLDADLVDTMHVAVTKVEGDGLRPPTAWHELDSERGAVPWPRSGSAATGARLLGTLARALSDDADAVLRPDRGELS